MTVAELLARISSKELTEWMVFYNMEPFGGDTQYLGHAITASTIANVNRKKGQKAYDAEDFIPKFKKEKKQSMDEMVGLAQMMAMSGIGKIKDTE